MKWLQMYLLWETEKEITKKKENVSNLWNHTQDGFHSVAARRRVLFLWWSLNWFWRRRSADSLSAKLDQRCLKTGCCFWIIFVFGIHLRLFFLPHVYLFCSHAEKKKGRQYKCTNVKIFQETSILILNLLSI